MSIMDKLASRARVRVYKASPGADDRKQLCGENMQKGLDADGVMQHFFEIPAHQADYINKAFRHYRVSEPFIPGADDAALAKMLDKPPIDGVFTCGTCGKSFDSERALNGHMSSHK